MTDRGGSSFDEKCGREILFFPSLGTSSVVADLSYQSLLLEISFIVCCPAKLELCLPRLFMHRTHAVQLPCMRISHPANKQLPPNLVSINLEVIALVVGIYVMQIKSYNVMTVMSDISTINCVEF